MSGVRQRFLAYARGPSGRAALAAAFTLAALLLTWWYARHWYEARLLREERAEATADTSLRGTTLSLAINRRIARLQGLSAFVQVESSVQDLDARFETFAAELYAGAQGIRYLAVAPGGIVRYVYPLAGNEALLATNMLHDPRPQVQADTLRCLGSGRAVATGPVELPDGSVGLIAREPLYLGDGFAGLVAIALDVQVLLDEGGFTGDVGDLAFALRDSEDRVFFGSPAIVDQDPVLVEVQLLEETWELAAVPAAGWGSATRQELLVFEIGGVIIVLLVAGLSYLVVSRQAWLAEAVAWRTREMSSINAQLQLDIAERRRAEAALAEREEQYRSIFESTSDGLLIFDLEGRLVDYNPAAGHMLGEPCPDSTSDEPSGLIHPSSALLLDQFLEQVRAKGEFHGRAVSLRRDGTPFHVELDGTGFVYRGQPNTLVVIRDITGEVQAYQLLEQRVQQRTRELATLLDASANIASTLELRPLLGLILDQMQQVVDCTAASILLLERDELKSAAHRGSGSGEEFSLLSFADRGTELWAAMSSGKPVIVADVQADDPLAREVRHVLESQPEAGAAHVRTWMGVPFTIHAQLRGWLLLYHHQPAAYTSHHAALIQTIANQAATAIENAHLFAQTRRLAVLEERQRLARELHDSVSQVLYSIGLAGHTALTLLEQDPGRATEPMSYVLSLAEAGLAEMRALIFELRPDSLEKDGLAVALDRQAAALGARHELEVETELCEKPDLSLEVKEALYRIAREALNNIIKHAQASRVVIRLRAGRDGSLLEVQDDGIGFDPGREFPGQMGLSSMRERAAELRGTIEIESLPGKGTCIRVRIPA